jgi:hypothetical protein
MLSAILNFLSAPLTAYIKKQERKEELASAITEKKIELVNTAQNHKALWEIEAVKSGNTSWKDEYVTILFSLPAIICFIEPEVVERGFIALEQSPDWYEYSFLTVMLAAVGVKMTSSLFKFLKKR